MIPPIVKELTVPTTPDRAFKTFWSEIATWWPLDKHSLSGMEGHRSRGIEFEPKLGGQITEIMHDGRRELWGVVTEWTPGAALSFTWQLRQPDAERTYVRLSFAATEAGTKVTLTHSGWDAQGTDGSTNRENYNNGWNRVFVESYGAACAKVEAG